MVLEQEHPTPEEVAEYALWVKGVCLHGDTDDDADEDDSDSEA